MSEWCFVTGCIRIDDYCFGDLQLRTNCYNKLCNFFRTGTVEKPNKDCNVPKGSGDSLQVDIKVLEDLNNIKAFNIFLYGDLKDFNKVNQIIEWFKNIIFKIQKQGMAIRQAVIQVRKDDSVTLCSLACTGRSFQEYSYTQQIQN